MTRDRWFIFGVLFGAAAIYVVTMAATTPHEPKPIFPNTTVNSHDAVWLDQSNGAD